MTNSITFEISVLEIINMIRRRWKFISIIMLLFMLLCGGYKTVSSWNDGSVEQLQTDNNYERNKAIYDYFIETQPDLMAAFEGDWERICNEKMNNPVCAIDPYKCEYEQIAIHFSDLSDCYDDTVQNWISKADDKQLFGADNETMAGYKNAIIRVKASETSETSETTVHLIAVDGFDIEEAGDYLVDYFRKCADSEGIVIESYDIATLNGYNKSVDDYQQAIRNSYNSAVGAMTYSKTLDKYITEPGQPTIEQPNKAKKVLVFSIIGLILGLFVGIILIVLDAIHKREVVSSNQVERIFNLSLLSDCSSGGEASIDILNANLDVMTEEGSTIAVIADDTIEGIDEIPSEWNENSNRTFILCKDIFDNPESIESLKATSGILIGIKIGKSKVDQIQRILLKANKLNLNVLGYVLL